jgi:polyhydroxyalkanoate synthase
MIAYPGRTFGQLYHRLLKGNQLASGAVTMDDRTIRLADLTAPLLAFGGAGDGIAPVQCVRPIVDLVTGVDDLRFEIVPGGHLGMLTGRGARSTTWRIMDEWINSHSSAEAQKLTPDARRKAASAKKTAAATSIGANPSRRYGSAASRTLAARKK